jgi:hypothetical protein
LHSNVGASWTVGLLQGNHQVSLMVVDGQS